MRKTLSKILDDCITRIGNGETIEACLDRYPKTREQLKPLLVTSLAISAIPKVSPSDEFRRLSKARLMIRIRQESSQAEAAKSGQRIPLLTGLAVAWQSLLHMISGARRVTIPITLALLLALGVSLGLPNFLSLTPALASPGTLSILSGTVEIQSPEAASWRQGTDGMSLSAGTRVRTAPDSHVLLTFFEGSTIKLDPNTDLEIQQIEYDNGQAITIVLRQRIGRTWSRVVKTTVPGPHYQIETPSASATVWGTMFMTEVDEAGSTQVATTEGLVNVTARGQGVNLSAKQRTRVEIGTVPSPVETVPEANTELIITVAMPAVGSVSDPTGASTGSLPDGLSFNQILGSQSSSTSEGTQLITIPQPMTGEYTITLRYTVPGTTYFNIQGKSKGKVVFEYEGKLIAINKSEWSIGLNLQIDDGLIVSSKVSEIEPLGDETPEKIVATESAEDGAAPIKSPGQKDQRRPDQDGGQGQDGQKDKGSGQEQGDDKDKGNGQKQGGDKDKGSGQEQGDDKDKGNGQEQDGDKDKGSGQGQGEIKDQGSDKGSGRGQGQDDGKGQGSGNKGGGNTRGGGNDKGGGNSKGNR